LYTSLTLQEIDEVVGPFTKKYPFLKLESFRGNALQLLQKMRAPAIPRWTSLKSIERGFGSPISRQVKRRMFSDSLF
jgi:hypothetical protein